MSKVRKIKMTIKGVDVVIKPYWSTGEGLPNRTVFADGVHVGDILPYHQEGTKKVFYSVNPVGASCKYGFKTIAKAVAYILELSDTRRERQ